MVSNSWSGDENCHSELWLSMEWKLKGIINHRQIPNHPNSIFAEILQI